jgi:hypothetical protein
MRLKTNDVTWYCVVLTVELSDRRRRCPVAMPHLDKKIQLLPIEVIVATPLADGSYVRAAAEGVVAA